MARPGFNCSRWFQYAFDEAVMVGWLGQFSSGTKTISSFQNHVRTYAPKIAKFHKIDADSFGKSVGIFKTNEGILEVLKRVSQRTKILEGYDVSETHIQFGLSQERLKWEMQYLKDQGIETVVSLTEEHHHKDQLATQFDLHHIAIEDLGAPKVAQVLQLAELIKSSMGNQKKLAVHCLAGIGRTSTMLMSAHITMGESAKDLELLLAKQNPAFQLTGSQADFIRSFSERLDGKSTQ